MTGKAAYKHEYEQQRTMRYVRIIDEYKAAWLDDPWTNDLEKKIKALIQKRSHDRKVILKAKDMVMRGVKE